MERVMGSTAVADGYSLTDVEDILLRAKTVDRGNWIETYSGHKFYVMDPKPEDIDLEDVSHALSNACRFSGHTKYFYSVAEHSINVANRLFERYGCRALALKGLVHDASESVFVDIPSPIKPYLTNYKKIEQGIQDMLYVKFCGAVPNPVEKTLIKEVDLEMLWIEGYQLMPSKTKKWDNNGDRAHYEPIVIGHVPLECYTPASAKGAFNLTFNKFSV